MDLGSHGSTFGGNPFACAVSMKALEVVKKEHMIKNSEVMGEIFRNNIEQNILIKEIRGNGLLNGIEFNEEELKKRNKNSLNLL
jgi:ornithine--oxo-acid transaminase